jgi:hypothetical protein
MSTYNLKFVNGEYFQLTKKEHAILSGKANATYQNDGMKYFITVEEFKKTLKNLLKKLDDDTDTKDFTVKDMINSNFMPYDLKSSSLSYIQYYIHDTVPKSFANGSNLLENVMEIINLKFKYKEQQYYANIRIDYECSIAGHSGDIEEYNLTITSFVTDAPDNVKLAIIYAANIILANYGKVLKINALTLYNEYKKENGIIAKKKIII